MARHLIQNSVTGESRIVGDAGLAFFPGYAIIDTLEDGQPPAVFYGAGESDLRYVNVSEISDPESAASVALRAASVAAVLDSDEVAAAFARFPTSRMVQGMAATAPNAAPVHTSPPTITQTTTQDATLTRTIPPNWAGFTDDGLWEYDGGTGQAYPRGVTKSDSSGRLSGRNVAWRAFSFDGAGFQLRFASQSGLKLRIWVDGLASSATIADPPGGVAGGNRWLDVRFSAASRGKPREIVVELENASSPIVWGSLLVLPADSIGPSKSPSPRLVIVGDSYAQGVSAGQYAYSYAASLGRMLGWRRTTWSQTSIASTGLVKDASATIGHYLTRLAADVVPLAPDVVIVQGSVNDVAYVGQNLIGPALTTYVQTLKAAVPTCKVLVTSPLYAAAPLADHLTVRNELQAAATALGVPFIDIMGTVPAFSGTGKVGATNGSGNSDFYLASDGSHASPEGAFYLARMLAGPIAEELNLELAA